MVVEVTGRFQFLNPVIKTDDARLSIDGPFKTLTLRPVTTVFFDQTSPGLINQRSPFKPTLPVSPPADFLEERLGLFGFVLLYDGFGNFRLRDQSVSNVRREAGDSPSVFWSEIVISILLIVVGGSR